MTTSTRIPIGFSLLAVFVLLLIRPAPAAAQRGAITVPRNLAELNSQAAVIVHGRVVNARVEPHPDFPSLHTVVVTLKVEDLLKGQAGLTFTFRQFIWDIRDRWDNAGYRKGQELVLLMSAPTPYGLSSAAGLGQGRFRVVPDAAGNRMAINERNNAGLFDDFAAQTQKMGVALTPQLSSVVNRNAGPVRLQDLLAIIRSLNQGK